VLQQTGQFVLSLKARGDLRPNLATNGAGVDFLTQTGSKILTYSGLLVVDADGKQLPAWIPPTISPVALRQKMPGSAGT